MPQAPDTVYAIRPLSKASGETRVFCIDMANLLTTGVTLTGTPTVTSDLAGLSLGSPTVNGSIVTDPAGNTVAASKGVQISIGGGSKGRYVLSVYCGTTGSETIGGKVILLVDV